MSEFYLKIARLSWGMLLAFVLILLIVGATANNQHIDGALKGGILAIGVFMLICVILIGGKTLLRDGALLDASTSASADEAEPSSVGGAYDADVHQNSY